MASVFCVIQDQSSRKVLLVQRAYDTSRPFQFSLPGGRRKRIAINEVEAPATAVVREVLEETGLEIRDPKLLNDFGDQAYFIASVQSPSVTRNEESMGYVWVAPTVDDLKLAGQIMN
jgi:ADP-ribose pyrophosphatase YjhB (NUDIX family)